MPVVRTESPEDGERILSELRTVAPIPLTRLDLTEVLRLHYRRTSELLKEAPDESQVWMMT